MNDELILAIDQSTQGTKAMIFDSGGSLLGRADMPHSQIITKDGYVEHDPEEIYKNTISVVRKLISENDIEKDRIACIGISNQRETVAIWDKVSGKPVYNAIVWQCGRAVEQCDRISDKAERVQQITGLPLSPYFSAAKAAWILEQPNIKAVKSLAIGTMDSWLLWKLCGVHKTDYSNAARTQLFDIKKLCWSEEVCGLFGISKNQLPEVCASDDVFGYSDFEGIFEKPLPICGVLGDSNGALLAQGCFSKGETKGTFGTGSSIMMNAGKSFPGTDRDVATSLAWKLNGTVEYVLEGNINYTGAIISWLCNDVKLISSAGESGELAKIADKEDTTYLVPAFTGLGAPYWNSNARASFTGMSRTTGKAELAKAGLEAIAYQIYDVAQALERVSGHKITALRADGGPTKNDYLMQFQADILKAPVMASSLEELSGAGAAFAAGKAAGILDMETAVNNIGRKAYEPMMTEEKRRKLLRGWKKAIEAVLSQGT